MTLSPEDRMRALIGVIAGEGGPLSLVEYRDVRSGKDLTDIVIADPANDYIEDRELFKGVLEGDTDEQAVACAALRKDMLVRYPTARIVHDASLTHHAVVMADPEKNALGWGSGATPLEAFAAAWVEMSRGWLERD